jgi:hypothetical protein
LIDANLGLLGASLGLIATWSAMSSDLVNAGSGLTATGCTQHPPS